MKFAALATFGNVVQPTLEEVLQKDYPLKGKWKESFFKNDKPIVLELGCGKGEYTIGLAERFPDKNFMGVDIKGARIWKGAKYAWEKGMTNVGFLRTHIEHITSLFATGEISEIWITFPDPQPKKINTKKRLTSSVFLQRYALLLETTGFLHLKTDNELLYRYTVGICEKNQLAILDKTDDMYHSHMGDDILSIRTFYEAQYLAKNIPIKYIRFTLNNHVRFEEPEQSGE